MHLTLDDLRAGPRVTDQRPIVAGDLAALRTRAPVPPRQKLRHKHHALARSLASGVQESAAAMICGFAPVTVSILKKDPAFAELVRFYETENGKGFDYVRAQVLGVGQKLVEEIERRVVEAPEEISMRDLRDTAETLLDRGGLAPQTHQTHDIHLHSGLADALRASRLATQQALALPAPKGAEDFLAPKGAEDPREAVIDGEFEELPGANAPPSPTPGGSSGPSDSVLLSEGPPKGGGSMFAWDED